MQTSDALYEVSLRTTHSTVKVDPALTEAEWEQIERAGDDILAQIDRGANNGRRPTNLLFDLSSLEYMGSSMVAMIVRCWKSLNPKRDRFVVVAGNEVVRQVLELSGLSQMWTIAETPEAGLKSLGISPQQAAQPVAGESTTGRWATVLAVLAMAVAIGGVGLWFSRPDDRELATGLIYGGAGTGFVMGLLIMMVASSRRRFVGLAVVLLSVGAGAFRLIQQ